MVKMMMLMMLMMMVMRTFGDKNIFKLFSHSATETSIHIKTEYAFDVQLSESQSL